MGLSLGGNILYIKRATSNNNVISSQFPNNHGHNLMGIGMNINLINPNSATDDFFKHRENTASKIICIKNNEIEIVSILHIQTR